MPVPTQQKKKRENIVIVNCTRKDFPKNTAKCKKKNPVESMYSGGISDVLKREIFKMKHLMCENYFFNLKKLSNSLKYYKRNINQKVFNGRKKRKGSIKIFVLMCNNKHAQLGGTIAILCANKIQYANILY